MARHGAESFDKEVSTVDETRKLERKLRRTLRKSGYALHKSRKQNCNENNQGGYMIYDMCLNAVISGSRYDLTLDDVVEWAAYCC